MRPKVIRGPSRSSTTGTRPRPVSSTMVGSCSGAARTKALPSTGCPANGSSLNGVKIRILACPPLSAGYTKTVSEKFISRAIGCRRCSGTSRASVKTASWLPASGRSVKTSQITYRKSMVAALYATGGICHFERRLRRRNPGGGLGGGRRGPLRSGSLMRPRLVEAVRALDALLGAGDVLLLQLLEVGHARHDVMALRGVAGLRLLQPPLRLLLVLGQLLQRVPRGVHPGVGGEERDEDELVAELTQLLEGEGVAVARPLEGRGVVEGERQVRVRLAHGVGELDGRLARGVRQLGPHGVDAGVGVHAAARDSLLQAAAHRAVGVGARDDEEVGVEPVAHVDGGAVLAQRLLAAHAHLAGDVAAALREALVLEVDAGHAGLDHFLDR